MEPTSTSRAVSFDLFGTLVAVNAPADPAAAVAAALEERGVSVPGDWHDAYREPHLDVPAGGEVSLVEHVRAALSSRGVTVAAASAAGGGVVAGAVADAFEPAVETRPGAVEAVAAAADSGPVGVLSNCSVPGLARRSLERSSLDRGSFDAVVTSVDCGWRKPDPRAFQAVAQRLGVPVTALWHVGDDPEADGAASAAGATAVLLADVPLADLPAHLEGVP